MNDETFFDKMIKLENEKNWMRVENWMIENYSYIYENQKVYEAAKLLKEMNLDYLVVMDDTQQPIGIVSFRQLADDLIENRGFSTIKGINTNSLPIIEGKKMIHELLPLTSDMYIVIAKNRKFIGVLTRKEIFDGLVALMNHYLKNEKTTDILNVILSKAYEGVAVVDSNAKIIEFNEAYSKFTGVPREKTIGKHVTEVIENTNLHHTVEQGIPDRGAIQNIQGQDMVVHRIPIWKNGKVVGAIGMLIFEGVSEVYKIYEHLQLQKIINVEPDPIQSVKKLSSLEEVIGISEKTAELKREAREAASSSSPILLIGEEGAGRRILSEGIHSLTKVKEAPFIKVELKNHQPAEAEKLLFDNDNINEGKIKEANKGTLFLSNIDLLSLEAQINLEKIIRSRKLKKNKETTKVDVRVMASTSKSIEELVKEKKFSQNLYDMFSKIHLFVPPLRERREDIPSLLSFYMKEVCYKNQVKEKSFSPKTVRYMMKYDWPGNIDELVRNIEYLVENVEREVILYTDLPIHMLDEKIELDGIVIKSSEDIQAHKDKNEKEAILSLLAKTGGNKSKTAELMGIHRTTLYKKLKKFNILT